jgi:hypothetical protein
VGLPNETSENPATQSANNLGAGTDVLYGWLVGRAAADLGLAQALAASEAQRREQIKRLEESLLAQIRELQDRHSANSGDVDSAALIDPLKLELERVGARQAQLEAAQQNVERLEAAMNSQLGEFAAQMRQQAESFSSGNADDVKFEIKLLADRIARAEFAAQRAQTETLSANQRIENTISERLQAQVAASQAQFITELQARSEAPNVSADQQEMLHQLSQRLGQLESSLNPGAIEDERSRWGHEADKRLDALVVEVGEQLRAIGGAKVDGEAHAAELAAVAERLGCIEQTALLGAAELKAELGALKTRLDEPQRPVPVDDSAIRRLDETINGRIAELQDKLTTALSVVEQRDGALLALDGRLSVLADKVAELSERAVDRGDMAELKSELSRDDAKSAQSLVDNLEKNIAAKIGALEGELTADLQRSQNRDGVLDEIRGEIELLAQRWLQTDTSARQTHEFIANELAQAAQLREGMVGELTALQNQLTDRQERDRRIESLATDLSARIFDVQAQLSQNLATLVSRDAEIAALKVQVEQMAQTKNAVPLAAPNRLHTAISPAVGLGGLKPQSEVPPAQEPASLLQRYDADSSGAKQEKRHLQERISADIERVRAELRKRAGVGR